MAFFRENFLNLIIAETVDIINTEINAESYHSNYVAFSKCKVKPLLGVLAGFWLVFA